MVEQSIFNWALGVFNIIIGFILKWIWDSHRELRQADKELADKVSKIEVLVAGEYVKREDFDKVADAIFAKLDKISEKLDRKVDK